MGNVRVEHDGRAVGSDRLPGRQGRLLLACLVVGHERPIPREELAELLWGEAPPPTWDKALAVLVSKLRALLVELGLPADVLTNAFGCYQLQLPEGTWVDVLEAHRLLAEADRARDAGALGEARTAALTAGRLARETFLPGEQGDWVDARRADLRLVLVASLDRLADIAIASGDGAGAVAASVEACELEPFRETSHQRLMRAHAACGNRAEALRAFDRCRHLLVEELGVDPAPETQAVYLEILRATAPDDVRPVPLPPVEPSVVRHRRSRLTPLLVAAGAALAVVAGLLVVLPEDVTTAVPASSLAAVDAASGRVRSVVPLSGLPGDVVGASGSLWVAVPADGTVSRVDPGSGRVTKVVVVDARLSHLTTDGTQVWFSTTAGAVGRIDPTFNTVTHLAQVPSLDLLLSHTDRPLSSGLGALWLADPGGLVVRIDPRSGQTRPAVEVGAGVSSLSVADSGAWVSNGWDGTVSHVDTTNVVAATIPVGHGPHGVAATADAVWVAGTLDGRLVHIDPRTNAVTASIAVPGAPEVVAAAGRGVWVGGTNDDVLTRVDARTDKVTRRVRLGSRPQGIAVAGGLVWVATGPTYAGAVPAKGGVLRMDVQDQLTTLDPVFVGPGVGMQIAHATCGGLVGYPAKPSRAGFELVPELAEAVPSAQQGGRVYRFRVPSGRRFGAPSQEPITAETFRHVIERVLDPRTEAPGAYLMPDVEGLRAFQAHPGSHLSGLRVEGDTLSVTLTAPSARVLHALATPTFCAVPLETPHDPRGVASVPSSGPYSVKEFDPGRRIVLRRNPAYSGVRPATVDEIDVALGLSPDDSLRRVESGASDYAAGGLPTEARASLAARYGEGSPAAASGRQRFFSTPAYVMSYIVLNASRPLFGDVTVRRAVGYALDRPALAEQEQRFSEAASLVGGPAFDGLLPAEFPGVTGRPVYPVSGPDLVRARGLMRGRRATAVLYTCTASPCPQLAAVLRDNLGRIGIDVQVRAFPKPVMFNKLREPRAAYDLTTVGWGGDHGAAETWFDPLIGNQAFTGFSEQDALAAVNALQTLPAEAHTAAAARFARDLYATHAPALVYAQKRVQELFSSRAGCQVFHPVYGMDLGSVCLQ